MSSFGNWNEAFTQTESATENPLSLGVRQVVVDKGRSEIGIKDQQDLQRSMLRKPSPLMQLDPYDRFSTSAVFGPHDLRKLPSILAYEISRDAEDFINKQKKSVQLRKDITAISDRAMEFLNKEGIKAKVSVSLFTDPEYDDWIEPKIRIEVPENELARTYKIYNELLSCSFQKIRKRTLRRLLVTVESI
jgi:hypothetical protein